MDVQTYLKYTRIDTLLKMKTKQPGTDSNSWKINNGRTDKYKVHQISYATKNENKIARY